MGVVTTAEYTEMLRNNDLFAFYYDKKWHVTKVTELYCDFYVDVEDGVIDGHFEWDIVGVADELPDAIADCLNKMRGGGDR